ncbi:MAG: hypothetical protein MSIBF_03010 [Candidatus Altiarchaeales archaeon IMC4]|nr:MAG: hypothetical protein MSIBF_03010 [Candidatus Altiarchaeales archaeon IMC4]
MLVLLFGVVIGIILGVEIVHLAGAKSCPSNQCPAFDAINPGDIFAFSDAYYTGTVIGQINIAESSIDVVMFEVRYYKSRPESSANKILESLVAAKKRGVNVRVVAEGGEAYLGDSFEKGNKAGIDYLVKNGVGVRLDPKNVTTHAKLVVIDGKTVIVGSTNWNYNSLDNNHETDILVNSQKAAQYFGDYFERLWRGDAT